MGGQLGEPPLAEDDFKTAQPRARGREGRGHGHRGPAAPSRGRTAQRGCPARTEIDALDNTFANTFAGLTRWIAEIDGALAAAEDRWLALSSDYESAMGHRH
jgi:hypothetical protein